MALQKNINVAGNTFAYWRLTKVSFNALTDTILIEFGGYKDRDTRLSNMNEYVGKFSTSGKFSDVTNWNVSPKQIAYQVATRSVLNESQEETNFWADATDVLE